MYSADYEGMRWFRRRPRREYEPRVTTGSVTQLDPLGRALMDAHVAGYPRDSVDAAAAHLRRHLVANGVNGPDEQIREVARFIIHPVRAILRDAWARVRGQETWSHAAADPELTEMTDAEFARQLMTIRGVQRVRISRIRKRVLVVLDPWCDESAGLIRELCEPRRVVFRGRH